MLCVPSTSALTIPALFKHPFSIQKLIGWPLGRLTLVFCIISEFWYACFKWRVLFSAYSQNTPFQETVGYFKPCFLSLLKLFMYSLFTFYYSITSKKWNKDYRQCCRTWGSHVLLWIQKCVHRNHSSMSVDCSSLPTDHLCNYFCLKMKGLMSTEVIFLCLSFLSFT